MPRPLKKLKIAFLLEHFPCLSETFILNQIVYLLNQGHAVDIYAEEKGSLPVHPQVMTYNLLTKTKYFYRGKSRLERIKQSFATFITSRNKLLLLKTLNFVKYGRDAYAFRGLLKAEVFSKSANYDLVHAHFGSMGKDVVMLQGLGLLKGVPLITSFHGYDINPKDVDEHRKEYKELFKVARLVTANSNFTLTLLKEANCPVDKLVKLPVSVDTSVFKRNTSGERISNIINVFFCGRLVEFKAPELIPEIANILINNRGNKNVRFHIIGKGPLKKLVEEGISKYHLNDYMVLHGAKTQDKIIDMMSDMDIFLYPGINDKITGRVENQGLVLQEAQSMELPVVTSNVGGIPEGVIDGKTAFVLKEGDIEGFADKIELLILDQKRRQQMGQQARDFVVNNFDFEILGRRLEQYYDSILQ